MILKMNKSKVGKNTTHETSQGIVASFNPSSSTRKHFLTVSNGKKYTYMIYSGKSLAVKVTATLLWVGRTGG